MDTLILIAIFISAFLGGIAVDCFRDWKDKKIEYRQRWLANYIGAKVEETAPSHFEEDEDGELIESVSIEVPPWKVVKKWMKESGLK